MFSPESEKILKYLPEPLSPAEIYRPFMYNKLKSNGNLFTVTCVNPTASQSAELACALAGCRNSAENLLTPLVAYWIHAAVTNEARCDCILLKANASISIDETFCGVERHFNGKRNRLLITNIDFHECHIILHRISVEIRTNNSQNWKPFNIKARQISATYSR